MAWLELTTPGKHKVLVNMDLVFAIERYNDHQLVLRTVAPQGDGYKNVYVVEEREQILELLREAGGGVSRSTITTD